MNQQLTIEDALDLKRALRRLPPRYRRALLTYADHGTLDTVAVDLRLSRQGAAFVLHTACSIVRTWLSRPLVRSVRIRPRTDAVYTRALARARHKQAMMDVVRSIELRQVLTDRERRRTQRCEHPRCPWPDQPIRSGHMHQACRAERVRAAVRRKWNAGAA